MSAASEKIMTLVVAGSGKVSKAEVSDLLDDFTHGYDGVDIIFPVDSKGFTDVVRFTTEWTEQEVLYPVLHDGGTMSRKARAFKDEVNKIFGDSDVVSSFGQIFTDLAKETKDDLFFAVAPADLEEEEELHLADCVLGMSAAAAGFRVVDFTAGLDDLTEEFNDGVVPEPDPEPEPEPPKPARKSRAAKGAAANKKTADPPATLETDVLAAKNNFVVTVGTVNSEDVAFALDTISDTVAMLEKVDESNALLNRDGDVHYRKMTTDLALAHKVLGDHLFKPTQEAPSAPEKAAEVEEDVDPPKRGRGRPRQHPAVTRQVWDEVVGEWLPRPQGRLAKGTKQRTLDAAGEVTEESVE